MDRRTTYILLAAVVLMLTLLAAQFALRNAAAPDAGEENTRLSFEGPLREVSVAISGPAGPEVGGFFQAIARGFYLDEGLDVEIISEPPSTRMSRALIANEVEFAIAPDAFIAFNVAAAEAPATAVMASFQKHPLAILTHPREDISHVADMAGHVIGMDLSRYARDAVWLKARFGFEDAQITDRPFDRNAFLSDESVIQSGSVFSAPYALEKDGQIDPKVHLLADIGYPNYASIVMTQDDLISADPEFVQAFVDASIRGWESFLRQDPSAAMDLMINANPELTRPELDQARAKMRSFEMVEGGDAFDYGVGTMSETRWGRLFAVMASNGAYPRTLPFDEAYTLQFVRSAPVEN